jgi:hypothetical protein
VAAKYRARQSLLGDLQDNGGYSGEDNAVCEQDPAIDRLYDDLLDTYSVSVEPQFSSGETRDASSPGEVYMSDTGAALGPHADDFDSLKQSVRCMGVLAFSMVQELEDDDDGFGPND